ncbi:MAG: hypothetical protein KGQ51_13460, partial [Planctomycetes bacterium]|nr:hypothetical protein [Planctomycetota bacterium]
SQSKPESTSSRVGTVGIIARFSAIQPGCLRILASIWSGATVYRSFFGRFFISMGLVPIGRQSQGSTRTQRAPITMRVYPRRMMIGWSRASSNPTPVAKPPSVPPCI